MTTKFIAQIALALTMVLAGDSLFSAPLPVPAHGRSGFTLLDPAQTGLRFTNSLSNQNAAQNQIRLNGSGVALGDIDGDGWCDILLCSLEGHLALYRNLGNWQFTNITALAGLDMLGNFSTGATFADVDGNGSLDLLVNGIGTGTRLFLNDGKGHFTESANSGLLHQLGAMTCALADVDGDGALDLYVANYRTTTVRTTGFSLLNMGGKRMIRPEDHGRLEITPEGRVLENGEPDVLYHNDGHGHFTPVSWTNGAFLDEQGRALSQPPLEWGLTAAFRDLNGDGYPDLYVCNDFHSPDRIWLNDGHGRFRALPQLAIRHTATFSMSVDFADVDRDGRDDILVSDMTSRNHGRRLMQIAAMDPYEIRAGQFEDRPQLDRTVLQWNRGDGTYAEIAHYAGLENSEWNWSVIFLDVDLDGFEDVLASTGHMFDTQDLDAQDRIRARGPYRPEQVPGKLLMLPPLNQTKLAFRNRGDLTFEESGAAWGFNQVGVAHGMALADLDNDGDLDLVVNNLNDALGVYRNETAAPRIAVRLRGRAPNTRGIGASIRVTGGPVAQSQEMMCGGRYLSCDDAMRVFAAGTATNRLCIELTWRNGKRSVISNAQPNSVYEIDEVEANSSAGQSNAGLRCLFEDVSARLGHLHHEEPFDDFARQPLLPKRLSQLGPGVGWWDLDGDGWEDLLLGSGQSGQLALYQNDTQGGFKRCAKPPWMGAVARDQTAIAGWLTGAVLVGSANYEDGQTNGAAANAYQWDRPQPLEAVTAFESSVGPLAVADYDLDGELDLFVGGRVLPGRYPAPADSKLYRGRNGQFVLDEAQSRMFSQLGLISGAVWSDLDADGWPELILACEWGPIRIFHNEHGALKSWDIPLAFQPSSAAPQAGTRQLSTINLLTGWWNGVTTGDFDGDGRMDIIASNWGRNTKYRASPESPRRIYYADFSQQGGLELIEACREGLKELPDRDLDSLTSSGLAFLRERFPSYAAYGQATLPEVLGDALKSAKVVEAVTLDSMLFLNRTNSLVAIPLPSEAQFSPAFAVCVADFDGDGAEDLFLSQNFFASEPKTPRCDAGRGLLLRGDGRGNLRPVPGEESGIRVYGEQRGAAVCDFDHDGRADLVVSQNGSQTCLFRNLGAVPGLRVRLLGPAGNPHAIGAVIRLDYNGRFGPAREIRGGSGYWSQDAPVQVMGKMQSVSGIQVRWPGGKITTSKVPARSLEITLDGQGEVKVVK